MRALILQGKNLWIIRVNYSTESEKRTLWVVIENPVLKKIITVPA